MEEPRKPLNIVINPACEASQVPHHGLGQPIPASLLRVTSNFSNMGDASLASSVCMGGDDYACTWTRLPDFDHSSSGLRPATAADADAAAAAASERLEASGWPPILTRALAGRMLLKLHTGPANSQGVAGVEGILSVSEGALVLGPALKRLSLSGFTRLDPDHQQGVYAVMSPQSTTYIAPPDYLNEPGGHVGRSTLEASQQQTPNPQQQQQQQQQQQGVRQQPGWLPFWWRAGRSSSSSSSSSSSTTSSFSQSLAWILRSSAGDEASPAAMSARYQQQQQQQQLLASSSQGAMGACKFRLELTVTRADDFWVASAATSRVAAAAAAAISSRAAMHSLHQKIGQSPTTQQQQQQQQQPQGAATAYTVAPPGRNADLASSKASWGAQWQQYLAQAADEEQQESVSSATGPTYHQLQQQPQQQQQQQPPQPQSQQQHQRQQQQQQQQEEEEEEEMYEAAPYPLAAGRRSAMEVPLPPGLSNTVLQIPISTPGSPAIGVLDEYEVAAAADADYAAGYEAGYAAAAAQAEAVASAAVAAAQAARNAAAAIAALPRQYNAQMGSVQGAVRALKVRDFPEGDSTMLGGAAAAAGGNWQQQSYRSLIEQGPQGYAAVAATAPAAVAAAPSNTVAASTAPAAAGVDSSSRYGVRSIFDAWILPCSHPKQRDTPVCRQQQLSSTLQNSGSSSFTYTSTSTTSSSSSREQKPRLHIQGLLISDNCQARWALSAVALPPGGLEVQALWYALLALLMCLVQVLLLRRQAALVTRSSAIALRVSLVGVCAGAQIDAFLSMAHLAASMSSPDISMPLLVVAAAQFALFAGADMTLLLHVWRAHDHHHHQQQRYMRQHTADAADGTAAQDGDTGTAQPGRTAGGSTAGGRSSQSGGVTSTPTPQWLAIGSHMSPYRANTFLSLWLLPLVVVAGATRQISGRIRLLFSGGRGSMGLFDSAVLGIEQLVTGRSLLMLYIRFYLVLLSATVLSWFMTSQLPLLLLAAFSFWVPQIWHNIIHTARQPLQPGYVLVSTAARLLLPVYLLCCPLNLLQLTPQPWLAAALLVWVGVQVAVLLLQHCTHPHVILPASWAPVRYNYHRVEVPWQFKEAAAEAAAAAKAAACVAFDPATQSLTAPAVFEQPAGGGSGHMTCCCSGVPGTCHMCSSRRFILQESYGNSGNSCTIRFSPRRQSSAAGAGVAGIAGAAVLRTNRAVLATETPLVAVTSRSAGGSSSSISRGLQTATSAPQQALQQQIAAEAIRAGAPQNLPCSNCGGKLNISSCNSFCNTSSSTRDTPGLATLRSSTSRWPSRQTLQQDTTSPRDQGQQGPLHQSLQPPGAFENSGVITRSISSGAQLQSYIQQEIMPHQQQLVLSLPAGAKSSVELSSRSHCQSFCSCRPGSSGGWSGGTCTPSSTSSSTLGGTSGPEDPLHDPLHDVEEGYDAFTGDGLIECVICMAGVRLLPLSERFVTPCGHFFHPECLTSWMEVKAECPQCRGPLPPL